MEIVGFLDDDMALYGRALRKKILGNRYHLPALSKLHNVQRIFICQKDEDLNSRFEIATLCLKANVQYHFVPFRSDWLHMDGAAGDMRPLVNRTLTEVRNDLLGKTVLINGPSAPLARAHIQHAQARMQTGRGDRYLRIPVERAPGKGQQQWVEGEDHSGAGRRDWEHQAEQVFRDYAPHIVLQTATRKYRLPHVPPDLEFIQCTNLSRSFKLAQLAMAHQAEIFCIISSHEAGNGKNRFPRH